MKFSFSFSLFPSTPHFLGHAGECCISSKDNLLFCLFYGYRTNNCAGLHGDNIVQFSSVAQSLRPHRLQHSRFPRPPPTPRGYSNSFPLSWWCHQTISSSVIPLSSCLQIFLARVSLCMTWPKNWSSSFSISPSSEYSGLISLVRSPCSQRDSE